MTAALIHLDIGNWRFSGCLGIGAWCFSLRPLSSILPNVGGTSGRDRFLLSKFPWHAEALAKEATFYFRYLTSDF